MLACIPSYLKTHSYGNVFDWAWADAYHRHGLEYYPKLLSAIPFTPCVGPRYMPANNREPELSQLLDRGTEWASEEGLTGWHVLFPEKPKNKPVQWLERVGTQYHWYNQDYTDFDDYLAAMTSRKRKNIKKERQRVVDQGISFRHLEGADISEEISISSTCSIKRPTRSAVSRATCLGASLNWLCKACLTIYSW